MDAGYGRGHSLLLVDIDEFKQVNDTHGHDVGDQLLLRIRDRLLRAARGTGVVARLGGDEFVLLTPTASAPAVADRIVQSLRAPVTVGALELRTSASVGLADVGTGPGTDGTAGTTLAELLTRADVAMYAAKAAGRDTVVAFHPDMRLEVARRYALTDEVRQLLGGDAPGVGRLEIHYQPLVELRSGEVVGAEALVRWRHPEHGLLAPDAFLGLVSTSGLDARLDTVVLRDVLAQVGRWRDQGRRALPVSVNLTRDSLADPRLADHVLGALAEAGVPPGQLHVEITEHQELPLDSPAAGSLERLLAAGVSTHLDDYGAGYTSLDYLRRFPVEVLKLDRSVIGSITEDQAQLLAGVRAMAVALDLELLAEGVETAEQRAELVALGVRYGQGYLFSRPLPADEYADRILGPAVQHVAAPPPAPTLPAPRAAAETLQDHPRG